MAKIERCKICNSPDRERIDKGIAAGRVLRVLALEAGVSRRALYSHRLHAAQALNDAMKARSDQVASGLVGEMRDVQRRAWELLDKMSHEGDHRGAVLAVRECREVLQGIDAMLTRAQEALNAGGITIAVVDAGAEQFCPLCPHCKTQGVLRPGSPKALGARV